MSKWVYAFKLSEQEVAQSQPPGTSQLFDPTLERNNLDREPHGHRILLVPRPSRSKADPLNWSKWRKYGVLFFVALYALAANAMSAIIAPSIPFLVTQFQPPKSLPQLTHLVSVNVLMFGLSNMLWVPLANIFGRRVVLLTATLMMTLASVWGGMATSFSSLLAARVFQGCGAAPADTIAPNALGEIFFVHERGRAMAIYTGTLTIGPFLGGLIGGYVTVQQGYKYVFWISTALCGSAFLACLLLVPETLFDREPHMESDPLPVQNEVTNSDVKADWAQTENLRNERVQPENLDSDTGLTYIQSLKFGIYRGGVTREFLYPWLTLRLPGVWVVMLHYSGLLGGIVTISTIGPQLLAQPPYLWGQNSGLINIAGIIGQMVGTVVMYLAADRILQRAAGREKHGLAEPEVRLPLLFPALFLATTGLWTFGFCADHPSPSAWVGMCAGLAMLSYGLSQIPSIGFNYIIDAYGALSGDSFVIVAILRGIISFSWTFFIGDWVEQVGTAEPFGIFGMLMGIFSLLTIPLWLWGKRIRIATAKYLTDPL